MKSRLNYQGQMLIQALVFTGLFVTVFVVAITYMKNLRDAAKINEPNNKCREVAMTALGKVKAKDFQVTYPLHLLDKFFYSGNSQFILTPESRQGATLREIFKDNQSLLRKLEWAGDLQDDPLWQKLELRADLEKFEEFRWPNIPIWKFEYSDSTKNAQKTDRTDFAASLLAMSSTNFFTALVKTYPELVGENFVEAPLLSFLVQKSLNLDSTVKNLKLTFKVTPMLDNILSISELVTAGKYIWPLGLSDPPHGIGFVGSGEVLYGVLPEFHPENLTTTGLRISKDFIKQRGVSYVLKVKVRFDHLLGRGDKTSLGMKEVSCVSEAAIPSLRRHHSFYENRAYSRVNMQHADKIIITFSNMANLKEHGVFPLCSAQWVHNRLDYYSTYPIPVKMVAGEDLKVVPCHMLKLFGKLPTRVEESKTESLVLTYEGVPPGGAAERHSAYVNYFLTDWVGNIFQASTDCSQCVSTPCACRLGTEACCVNVPWDPPAATMGFWVGGQQFFDGEIASAVAKETGLNIVYSPIYLDNGVTWYALPPNEPGILNNIGDGRGGFDKASGNVDSSKKPDSADVMKSIDAQKKLNETFGEALDQLREHLGRGMTDAEIKEKAHLSQDLSMLDRMIDKLTAEKKKSEDKIKEICLSEQEAQLNSCKPISCPDSVKGCSGCGGTGQSCIREDCGNTPIPGCNEEAYGGISLPPLPKYRINTYDCEACPPPPNPE